MDLSGPRMPINQRDTDEKPGELRVYRGNMAFAWVQNLHSFDSVKTSIAAHWSLAMTLQCQGTDADVAGQRVGHQRLLSVNC